MKTLEEYIAYCEEVADELEDDAKKWEYTLSEYQKRESCEVNTIPTCKKELKRCQECASEHRQLAEWLRELKAYKEAYVEIKNKTESGYFGFDDYEAAEANGYRKSIKIIDKCIGEVKADDD